MKLDDLHAQWAQDSDLDFSQPDIALRSIPILHAKWWRLFTEERQRYMSIKQAYDLLRHQKFEWYLGRMSDEERKQLGWAPQPLRIVRQEVDMYLANDAAMVPLAAKLAMAELKLKFIEDAIKHINGRGFLISSYVNWLKFSQGS